MMSANRCFSPKTRTARDDAIGARDMGMSVAWPHRCTGPHNSVIRMSRVFSVPESLHPLQELEVIPSSWKRRGKRLFICAWRKPKIKQTGKLMHCILHLTIFSTGMGCKKKVQGRQARGIVIIIVSLECEACRREVNAPLCALT
jgi:hypothetical protein